MTKIQNWPIGRAKLVSKMEDIPKPKKFIGELEGYYFYKTRHGEYAVDHKNSPEH